MAADGSSSGRFTSQGTTAQDLLASQTVGLVNLSDFRKRRADALEQKEREAGSFGRATPGPSTAPSSGNATPKLNDEGVTTPIERPRKKRKPIAKGKLSFGVEDEEEDDGSMNATAASTTQTSKSIGGNGSARASPLPEKSRLGPNSNIAVVAPRALTKAALRNESQTRDTLRLEFLAMQEAVRATEIVIPFVFYDGTNIPGGACKIKKGDHIWLFLDRARKLGAASGVNAAGERGGGSRRDWARVGVDDLIFVRGEVIIPHHYEIYYFLINKVLGPNSDRLFNYSDTPTRPPTSTLATPPSTENHTNTTPNDSEPKPYNPISHPTKPSSTTTTTSLLNKPKKTGQVTSQDADLEGLHDDPNLTKVVDRRWYERNKHIFPASVWEAYDPGKSYEGKIRTDARGNAFFFS